MRTAEIVLALIFLFAVVLPLAMIVFALILTFIFTFWLNVLNHILELAGH